MSAKAINIQAADSDCTGSISDTRAGRVLTLANGLISANVLPDRGADIDELFYLPRQIDVLWKSPWRQRGARWFPAPATDSMTSWMDAYRGGWQLIFPNGGPQCTYKNAELSFHGEASTACWDCDVVEPFGDRAMARMNTRLARSPFRIERQMRVERGTAILFLQERITNEGDEPMACMWGHHPAFGEPFIAGDCRIDVGAQTFVADDKYDGPFNPLKPGAISPWPTGANLSQVPVESPRHLFGYLRDFKTGWYAITSRKLAFGVAMFWPVEVFPFAWFWQEMNGSSGYPWYRRARVLAIEPFTSYPGQGLSAVMEKTGTHRTIQPGETLHAELRCMFYEGAARVRGLDADGKTLMRTQEGS